MRASISPYDPMWPEMFAAEKAGLQQLLQPWLIIPVEHIGSTSVPGLPDPASTSSANHHLTKAESRQP